MPEIRQSPEFPVCPVSSGTCSQKVSQLTGLLKLTLAGASVYCQRVKQCSFFELQMQNLVTPLVDTHFNFISSFPLCVFAELEPVGQF